MEWKEGSGIDYGLSYDKYGSIGDGTNVVSCKMVTMTHTPVLTAWELIQRRSSSENGANLYLSRQISLLAQENMVVLTTDRDREQSNVRRPPRT